VSTYDNVPDLSWLADSPMFIDGQQISAFYDAVVGPAFRTVELQISADRTEQAEKTATGRTSAGLTALFPWLKAEVEASCCPACALWSSTEQRRPKAGSSSCASTTA
jgi:hypothetical protein